MQKNSVNIDMNRVAELKDEAREFAQELREDAREELEQTAGLELTLGICTRLWQIGISAYSLKYGRNFLLKESGALSTTSKVLHTVVMSNHLRCIARSAKELKRRSNLGQSVLSLYGENEFDSKQAGVVVAGSVLDAYIVARGRVPLLKNKEVTTFGRVNRAAMSLATLAQTGIRYRASMR